MGRRSFYYLRHADSDGIRDDGLGAARSPRYTRMVIELGVSKTRSPSGSRTVVEGKLSSDLDAQVMVPHPAGNAQKGALWPLAVAHRRFLQEA